MKYHKEMIGAATATVTAAELRQFICLNCGFKNNDQLKANTVQTFASCDQGRDKQEQIVFRMV